MFTRSYKRLNLPDYFLWTETEATVRVGETVDVHFECNYNLVESAFVFSDSSKAELSSIQQGSSPQYATFQGNEIGTTTVTVGSSILTLNVAEADDKKFLNKRGLAHYDEITKAREQEFSIGQGSVSPVFDGMTPVRTIEWNIATANYRPIYTIANTGLTYMNLDATIAYRITVTGTNIHQVMDVVDHWHNPINYPLSSCSISYFFLSEQLYLSAWYGNLSIQLYISSY